MCVFRYHKGDYSATEADKKLIDFCLDWFISDQLSPLHRKTVPNVQRIQEIAVDIVFPLISLWLKKSTFSLIMSCFCTMISPPSWTIYTVYLKL